MTALLWDGIIVDPSRENDQFLSFQKTQLLPPCGLKISIATYFHNIHGCMTFVLKKYSLCTLICLNEKKGGHAWTYPKLSEDAIATIFPSNFAVLNRGKLSVVPSYLSSGVPQRQTSPAAKTPGSWLATGTGIKEAHLLRHTCMSSGIVCWWIWLIDRQIDWMIYWQSPFGLAHSSKGTTFDFRGRSILICSVGI